MKTPQNENEIKAFVEAVKKYNSHDIEELFSNLVKTDNKLTLEILLATLQVPQNNPSLRTVSTKAAIFLGHWGNKAAIDPLITILNRNSDPDIRANAAFALGLLKDNQAFPTLLAALEDQNAIVRGRSAVGLGLLGDKRAVEPIIQLLNRSSNDDIYEVVEALSDLKDGRAFEPMLESLNRCNDETYAKVIESLGCLNDPRVLDTLIEFVKNPNGQVQVGAVRGLMFLGDPKALPILNWVKQHGTYLDDLNISLEQHAIDAIEKIKRSQNHPQ